MENEQDVASPENRQDDPQAIVEGENAPAETLETGQEQAAEPQAEAEPQPKDEKPSREARKRQRAREAQQQLEARLRQAEQERDLYRRAASGLVEPKESDFEVPDEYVAEKAAWKVARQTQEQQANASEERVKALEAERSAAIRRAWAEQTAAARTRYADFEKVAYTAPISDEVSMLVQGMENGADVAYYLGSNPEMAAVISDMNPTQAAMELGRISAKVSAPKPRVKSETPPPINSVRGVSAAGASDTSNMSADQYRAFREGGGKISR